MRIAFLIILFVTCFNPLIKAQQEQLLKQDTLRLTISEGEQLFLNKNAELLAQKYNVDAQRALIIQAKIYPNPSISYGMGINRPSNASVPRETFAGLQQLIILAGKRKRQIRMAETTALLAEDNYDDLLRTLKYTLRSDLFSIYYWQQTAKVYGEEIKALKQIVTAGEKQLEKGFIAQTELVRDQAQFYSLQSEYNDLKNQINDKESEVRTIIDTSGSGVYIIPVIDTNQIATANPFKYSLAALVDSAMKNRTDLMIARDNLTLAYQTYKYQKSMAIPDLTISGGYDEYGSAWPSLYNVGVGIDLPFFNRNRGNIKSAKYMMSSDTAQYNYVLQQGEEQVFRAFEQAVTQNNLYQSLDKNFPKQFETLSKEVLNQYMKRNMGLLDFLTFYDSYKQNIVQLNNILANLANAYENVDYMTGTDFFYK